MTKKCYISGKISGIEHQAPELFANAEKEVVLLGFQPVNPMTINHSGHDQSWEGFMKEDIKALMDCDAIYLLRNFRTSKGANIEKILAEELKMEVLYQNELHN